MDYKAMGFIAEHYRECRKSYKDGFIDLRKEIMEMDRHIFTNVYLRFCSQNFPYIEENVRKATNYLFSANQIPNSCTDGYISYPGFLGFSPTG